MPVAVRFACGVCRSFVSGWATVDGESVGACPPEAFRVNSDFWSGRRVLITGHTGFKGAWLALWLEHAGAAVIGLALEPEDPNAAFGAFGEWKSLRSHIVDLRDAEAVARVIAATDPQTILHLGAQALVRRGYADPVGTYAVNVLGTANVLAGAATAPSLEAIVVVTSDKVYANPGNGRAFTEDDRLGGSDPYSNSKSCAELVAAAWRQSFFLSGSPALATARAGNVIGGGDRGDGRLVPDIRRSLTGGAPLRLRYPQATRPWQFVLEPLWGYLLLAERLAAAPHAAPHAVNFGPDAAEAIPVVQVVGRVFGLWGDGEWTDEDKEQPHEADSLCLDASLAHTALGWRPVLDLDTALAWTVEWWRAEAAGADCRKVALGQIEAYRARAAS